MVQFQNEFVRVELIQNATILVLTWSGYVPSALYRETLEKSLAIAKTHGITDWISDLRHLKILEAEDQVWVSSIWVQKAVSSGYYKRQAVIMAEDIFAGASARYIISAVQDQQIELRSFTSLEEAKSWMCPSDDSTIDQAEQ